MNTSELTSIQLRAVPSDEDLWEAYERPAYVVRQTVTRMTVFFNVATSERFTELTRENGYWRCVRTSRLFQVVA